MARKAMDPFSEMIVFLADLTTEEIEAMSAGLPEGVDRAGFIEWIKQNEPHVRLIHSGIDKTGACLAEMGIVELALPMAMGFAKLENAMEEAGLKV